MKLKDKVVLITGGALGYKRDGPSIGSAIALLFASEGANVVVVDILDKPGQSTVQRIQELGGDAIFAHADVSDTKAVQNTIDEVEKHYGALHSIVNCAASYSGDIFQNVVGTPEEDWLRTFDINFHGYYRVLKYGIPLMQRSGGGTIVNIASMAAFFVNPSFAVYPCTKAAILALTKSIAVDFAPAIRSNAICPGFVAIANSENDRTLEEVQEWHTGIAERYPLKRVCSVDEIAKVALFLASADSSYVNGAVINVDGGISVIGR